MTVIEQVHLDKKEDVSSHSNYDKKGNNCLMHISPKCFFNNYFVH